MNEETERGRVLSELEDNLAGPMALLGLAWLGLVIVQVVRGPSAWLQFATVVIWVLFVLELLLRLALAPDRGRWLRREWPSVVALALPPFRVFALARALPLLHLVRAAGGLRLVRLVAVANQGAATLRRALRHTRAGYAAALTSVVLFAGAAGMYSFEREVPGTELVDYAASLWWTAMLITTVGADYWPRTPEGRALCLVLAVYGCAMIGYLAGAVASLLLKREP